MLNEMEDTGIASLAWVFPTSALKGMPVSRTVGDRRVEGFVVGHEGGMVRFSEDPEGPGELVDPEALTRFPETSFRLDARRALWAIPVQALLVFTGSLVVVSWIASWLAPYRSITDPTLEARLQLVPAVFLVATVSVLMFLRQATRDWRPAPARLFDAMGQASAAVGPTTAPPEPVAPPSAQRSSDRRGGLHVGTLSLAFDATARRQIQASLETVARSASLSSSEGLGEALRSTATVLAEHGAGLQAGHGAVEFTRRPEASQHAFEKAVTAERGRYVIERVRVDADGARTVATASEARSEEGGGFVVVTLVVAWEGPGDVLDPVTSRKELDALVWRLQRTKAQVKALEVVWVPADPEDVMSSAEMGTLFPRLAWLDEAARRRFGQAVCAYCKAVYAREIGSCPNCGATAEPPGP